jgi:glycosyltransferase involved in cell wall biosynthesis
MRTALVHYWLVHRRGGERVLDELASLLPGSDLVSHVIKSDLLTGPLENLSTRETFIHRLPLAQRRYQAYLPLMPLALELMDMSAYDLIVSSEAGPAKWVIKDPDAHHICYCHSPLRYIWDQRQIYMKKIPALLRPVAEVYASHLRRSDRLSSLGVDQFVANSHFVARRINSYYRRDAVVIAPPVDVDRFSPRDDVDDYYLYAGELRDYKGVAIAIEAANRLRRRLVIVGGGPSAALKRAAGPTVDFVGRVSDADYDRYLARCRALLFPGVEDFGIVPVEVMASGRPVIARGKGGILDTVQHGVTGLLYEDPSVDGLMKAILEFEQEDAAFKPSDCVAQAAKFSRTRFREAFSALLPRGLTAAASPG